MPEITLSGRRFHWRQAGAGRPVLLAHCSLAHSGLWKPVIADLARDHLVLAPDMPAHGRSDPPPDGVALPAHAVAGCRALVGMQDRPVHLVGLSLGAVVLGCLALEWPARVASLTLIEPVWFHLLRDADPDALAEDESLMRGVLADAASGDFHAAARAFMEYWGMPGRFDAADAAGRDYLARCIRYLFGDVRRVGSWPPWRVTLDALARLDMPLMIVSGSQTRPQARAVCDLLHRTIQGSRRERIAGAGHLSPVTHPQAVVRLLRDFWGA